MKKILILCTMILICFALLQLAGSSLGLCRDVVLLESGAASYADQPKLINDFRDNNPDITDVSVYKMHKGMLSALAKYGKAVSVYETDGSYKGIFDLTMLYGRFISNDDIGGEAGEDVENDCIVLDKDTAVDFFATADCIGQKVRLDNKELTVIGVCQKRNTLLDIASSVENRAVYVPLGGMPGGSGGASTIMIKTSNNMAGVLKGNIQRYFERASGARAGVEDIDLKARAGQQKIKLVYFITLLIAAVFIGKRLWKYCKKTYAAVKNELKDRYLKGAVCAHARGIAALSLATSVFIAGICLGYIYLRPEIVIDPVLIPSRLINFEEIGVKVMNYIIASNNKTPVISYHRYLADNANTLINYAGIIFTVCSYHLLHYVHNTHTHTHTHTQTHTRIRRKCVDV